ncbi:type III polyketide synthase [Nocardiopsis kunsanensis]|uniref:type III polyketide synthase n=1 Tax=Nocardiopsis kunsanensis TaxID=141693 RepID=UPI000346B273|nr:type III polyketide synthase [Nocardiopsis kunsanensis]
MCATVIGGTGVALPETVIDQHNLSSLLPEGHGATKALDKIVAGSGIDQRRLAVDPRVEDVASWPTSERMERFQREGLPLARAAVATALGEASVEPEEIGLLCLVSSTGYGTPGVESRLLSELGMRPSTRRLHVGHMGCFAALPGLAACDDHVRAHRSPAVLVNLELSSLHLQPPPWDVEQLVINALFGDAAAAMVLHAPEHGSGPGVVDLVSLTDREHEDHMSWYVGDHGFVMGLSSQVPDLIGQALPTLVSDLLSPYGLRPEGVDWWAIHPGGRRIVDAVEHSLALDPAQVKNSREVLRLSGNCSSSGLPLVMDSMLHSSPLAPGEHGVAMTFGPGLTLNAALLRGQEGTGRNGGPGDHR